MARKKVIIQARELTDMDVNFLSLVKRGANRVPFRIIKNSGDSKMSLNLSDLFLQKKDAVPTVVAIALQKGADHAAYTEALKAAGFEVDHVVEGDNADTLMLIEGDELTDAVAYKISDQAAVIVAHAQKGLMTFADSNSFAENLTKAGFAPSYRLANEILTDTIGNIIFSEGDAEVTKSSINKAIDDFGSYIEAVMAAIPDQAFKVEKSLDEVTKGLLNQANSASALAADAGEEEAPAADAEEEAPAEEAAAEEAAAPEADADADAGEEETPAGDADASAGDDSEGEAEVEKTPAKPADKKTDDSDALVALQKSVDGMAELVKALPASITKVKDELSERIDAQDAKLKKTDEALSGTVNSEEAEDNEAALKKSQNPDGVSWDSALNFGEVELS